MVTLDVSYGIVRRKIQHICFSLVTLHGKFGGLLAVIGGELNGSSLMIRMLILMLG